MAEGGLRAAARDVDAPEHIGKIQEQNGDYRGYGAVALSRKHSRLVVDFGGDGYGDVSDGSHVLGSPDGERWRTTPLIPSVRRERLIICKAAATKFAIPFGCVDSLIADLAGAI
jgi:hypothetical protein